MMKYKAMKYKTMKHTSVLRPVSYALCLTGGLTGWIVGCGQDHNSQSQDGPAPGGTLASSEPVDQAPTTETTTESAQDTRRNAALGVLKAHCVSCHASWASYTTDESWVAAGLVTAAHVNRSKLMIKLINLGGNMPLGGSALVKTDYDKLVDWVVHL